MCRLFAFVAPEQSTARRELGRDGLASLLSLARLHGDGWGWAGVGHPGEAPRVCKSARSAVGDPDFDAAISTPARAAMVHLRWATAGLPVAPCNAHPFEADGLAFEHNGTLRPLADIRALLSPAGLAGLTGDTDSEMYFALIRQQVAEGSTPLEATVRTVRTLRGVFPLASLNALLLTREELIVAHASATSILTDDDRNRMGPMAASLPSEHNEDYFALRRQDTADGAVLIGSTGVSGGGWTALPAESVTAIRLEDRSSTTIELAATVVAHG